MAGPRSFAKKITQALLSRLAERLGKKRAVFLFARLAERFRVDEVVAHVALGGVRGRLDDSAVFMRYLRKGHYSPELNTFLKRCFADAPTGTFLDIGANIGLTTLWMAERPGVVARLFEPDPDNLALLRENLARNGLADRVEVFPFALCRDDGMLRLELSPENRGDHQIRTGDARSAPDTTARRSIEIPGRRLDGVLDAKSLARPLVAKCDAQGAEFEIWSGGAELLAEIDLLMIEYWPEGLARMGSEPSDLIALLAPHFDLAQAVASDAAISLDAFHPFAELATTLDEFAPRAATGAYLDLVLTKRAFAEGLSASPQEASA